MLTPEYNLNEADTCREYITPALELAGWRTHPHSITQERYFTDGRILVHNNRATRGQKKRADYLLRYRRDYVIAVVEAKEYAAPVHTGLQQAKDYADILGLKFAYATNGREVLEYDFTTGELRELAEYPSPEELWARLVTAEAMDERTAAALLQDYEVEPGKTPRYYQDIAIQRAVQAITQMQRRLLLTMATGTGKTTVAFQICWKLWNTRWNREDAPRRPRILFLADRNVLVDDPKDKTFTPFGDARFKIEGGKISKGREMYFALYQSLAGREGQPGLYTEYPRDFFDLIIVDECHRGSARDGSNWREVLEYFEPAYQLGMTATPLRSDNADTYGYFGDPIYTYSLKQGIEDGFLAPYTVHRVVTTVDATGWRPREGERDRFGQAIPDRDYTTAEFERELVIRERTDAMARYITDFLEKMGNPFAKTIVFCVDQEHAGQMMMALQKQNAAQMRQYPDYVARVTSDEGDVGLGHLSKFQDVDTSTPAILTTSKLLTTGVDAPMCRVIVIARLVNAMTEFKQIIGRGTRVRPDYDKLFFHILDFSGSATRNFADAEFDGEPVQIIQTTITLDGEAVIEQTIAESPQSSEPFGPGSFDDEPLDRRKFYVDGVMVSIAAEATYELDANGKRIFVRLTDYTGEQVRTLFPDANAFRQGWAQPEFRADVERLLADRQIEVERLATLLNQPEADALDLLLHVAYNAPVRSRRERADRVRREETAFFQQFSDPAQQVLTTILDKYAEHGTNQFELGDVLRVQPLVKMGNPREIAHFFGGIEPMKRAVVQLQALVYAA